MGKSRSSQEQASTIDFLSICTDVFHTTMQIHNLHYSIQRFVLFNCRVGRVLRVV